MAPITTSAFGFDPPSTNSDLFAIETMRTDMSGTNDPVCPGPSIRSLQDDASSGTSRVANSTRFQQRRLPRQKCDFSDVKRPTRTNSEISCATVLKKSNPISESLDNFDLPSDSESSVTQVRFCRPAQVSLCPSLRKSRRCRPVTGPRRFKASSPRRRRNVILGSSETRIKPRRAALPNRVRGKDHFTCSSTARKLHKIMGVGRPRLASTGETKQDLDLSAVNEVLLAGHKNSIDSVWNDRDHIQRFKNGFVNVQTGMMTFDEYYNEPSFGDEVMRAIHESETLNQALVTSPSHELGVSSSDAMKSTRKPSEITTSSKPNRASHSGLEMTTEVVADLGSGCRTSKETDHSSPCASVLQNRQKSSRVRWKVHGSTLRSESNEDLRKVPSMDSLSKIEASMSSSSPVRGDYSTMSPRQRLQKKQRFDLRDFSQNKTPSGEPPERPLPSLPTEQDDIRIDRRTARSNGNRRSWLVLDATVDDSPPSRTGSIANARIASNHEWETTIKTKRTARTNAASKSPNRLAAGSTSRSRRGSTSSSSYSGEPQTLVRHRTSTGTNTSQERCEKIRELKKKHIAILAKNRGLLRMKLQAASGDSTMTFDLLYNQLLPNRRNEPLPLPPSNPPPPPPPPSPRSRTDATGALQVYVRGELADQLDKFPPVPDIRPGSRSSVIPATPVQRVLTRPISRANSSSKRQHPVTEFDHSLDTFSHSVRRQQRLTQSQIMIICDTDPSTSTFRAGAISPVASVCDISRNISLKSSKQGRVAQTSRPSSPLINCALLSPTKFESIAEVARPLESAVTGKKRSLRNLRHQANTARAALTTPVRNGLACITPSSFSRSGSKQSRRQLWPEADADSDCHGDRAELIPKRDSSIKHTSKGSAKHRNSRYQSESSSTTSMTDLSKDMDELTRVLARFDNKGIKIRGCNLEDVARQVYQRKIDEDVATGNDHGSIASVSSNQPPVVTGSSVSVHDSSIDGKQDDEDIDVNTIMRNTLRTVSVASTITAAGTDTDTSAHTVQSELRKSASVESSQSTDDDQMRGSQDSLTDPADYDFIEGNTNSKNETAAANRTPQQPSDASIDVSSARSRSSSTSASPPHSLFIPLGSHPPDNRALLTVSLLPSYSRPVTTYSTESKSKSRAGPRVRSMIHPSGTTVTTLRTRPRTSSTLLPPLHLDKKGSSTTTLNTSSLDTSVINNGFLDFNISDDDEEEEDSTTNIRGQPWGIPETTLIQTDIDALDPHSRRNSNNINGQIISSSVDTNGTEGLDAVLSLDRNMCGVDRTSITDPAMDDLLTGMRHWANPNINLNLGNVQTYDQPYPLFSEVDNELTQRPSPQTRSQAQQNLGRSSTSTASASDAVDPTVDLTQSISSTNNEQPDKEWQKKPCKSKMTAKEPDVKLETGLKNLEGKQISSNTPPPNSNMQYSDKACDFDPSSTLAPASSVSATYHSPDAASASASATHPPVPASSSTSTPAPTPNVSKRRNTLTKERHKPGVYSSSSIIRSIARVWEDRPGGGGRVLHSTPTPTRRRW